MNKILYIIAGLILFAACKDKVWMPVDTKRIDSTKIFLSAAGRSTDSIFLQTNLSDGYYVRLSVYRDTSNKLIQAKTLYKADKALKILNKIGLNHHPNGLGYVADEFPESFLYVNSFGSNQCYIKLFRKSDGKELLRGVCVDSDEKEKVVVYMTNSFSDSVIIYDMKYNRQTAVTDFARYLSEAKPATGMNNYIRIDSISNEDITLTLERPEMYIRKKYKRK